MISELKKRFGYKCSGIKLNYSGTSVNNPVIELRFCEAINHSFHIPLLLHNRLLLCMGSRRSFGLLKPDEELIRHISEESHASDQTLKRALQDIPVLNKPIKDIFLGIQEEMESDIHPDVFILQVKPGIAMDIIKQTIVSTNTFPIIKPYPFLSVCGGVLVSALKYNQLTLSFVVVLNRENMPV